MILVNGVPFLEYKMTNGQALTVNVSKAMKAGNNNTIMLVGVGFRRIAARRSSFRNNGAKEAGDPLWPPIANIDW